MNPKYCKQTHDNSFISKELSKELSEWFKESFRLEDIEEDVSELRENLKFWCMI